MNRSASGRGATQRRVYGNAVPGGRAASLIVVSEQDWNDRVDDCVVVPCFTRRRGAQSALMIPAGDERYADCTLVQSIPQDELGPEIGLASGDLWTRIRSGVRLFLCIDQLQRELPPLQPERPNVNGWWPRQGDVRYRYVPAALATKMHAVITDDAWNSGQPYSCAARLTSRSKAWRRRWEGSVPGGWAIAADVFAVPHVDFDQSASKPPRPARLAPLQMRELAVGLQRLLSL